MSIKESHFRGVDLNLLVTLAVLLRERSVSRAAAHLHLGQPAVSGALARLRELFACKKSPKPCSAHQRAGEKA